MNVFAQNGFWAKLFLFLVFKVVFPDFPIKKYGDRSLFFFFRKIKLSDEHHGAILSVFFVVFFLPILRIWAHIAIGWAIKLHSSRLAISWSQHPSLKQATIKTKSLLLKPIDFQFYVRLELYFLVSLLTLPCSNVHFICSDLLLH